MICPKCGFEQGEGLECVRCGVIFARFRGMAQGQAPAPAPSAVPSMTLAPPPPPPSEAAVPHPHPPAEEPAGDAAGVPRGPRPQTMFDPNQVIVDPRAVEEWSPEPVSGSELLRESIAIFAANLLPFCLLTGLALTPSFVVGFLASTQTGYALFVSLVLCQPLATGAVVFGVFNQMKRRDVSLGACLRVGISSFGRVVLVGVAQAIWVGFLLFLTMLPVVVIGGVVSASGSGSAGRIIILVLGSVLAVHRYFVSMVKMSVAVPASIEETLGPIEAIRRSTELTAGNRWPIFRTLFFIGALNASLQYGTLLILQHVLHVTEALGLATTLVSVITTALAATASAVIYYRLRGFEESVDVDQIASVFG